MRTVVFIHGAWVTPACWDQFTQFFQQRGYTCLAPPWPRKDKTIDELRADPSGLAMLGVLEIVDHYEAVVRTQPEPPLLIGHSFGGLFVQMLLDRGLGAAGVAIDSAPPRGVFATELSVFRSNLPVLMQPGARKGVVRMTYPLFRYAFANVLGEADARAAYDQHVIPETGRIFFQAALGTSAVRVNFTNPMRKPLLMIAGERDHVVAAGLNRPISESTRAPGRAPISKSFQAGATGSSPRTAGRRSPATPRAGWRRRRLRRLLPERA